MTSVTDHSRGGAEQVYGATIDIKFVLVGFRYYMYHWHLSSLCLGTAVFCNLYLQLLRWVTRQLFGDEQTLGVDEEIAEVHFCSFFV